MKGDKISRITPKERTVFSQGRGQHFLELSESSHSRDTHSNNHVLTVQPESVNFFCGFQLFCINTTTKATKAILPFLSLFAPSPLLTHESHL